MDEDPDEKLYIVVTLVPRFFSLDDLKSWSLADCFTESFVTTFPKYVLVGGLDFATEFRIVST